MSEPKFTKGPWVVSDEYPLCVASRGFLRWVARVVGLDTEENRANAHLIAAAPEMYRACEALEGVATTITLTHIPPQLREAFGLAFDALAKARGEQP